MRFGRAAWACSLLIASLGTASAAPPQHDGRNTTLYAPDATTFLLSRSTGGGIPNGPSRNPAISQDQRLARYVAFESDASDLVGGDVNNATDVFYVERAGPYGDSGGEWKPGRIRLASAGMNGQPANGRSYLPALDGDSKDLHPRCLAFVSEASNLVPGDTNGVADVFIRNLDTGTLRRVSVGSHGQQANGPSFDVSLAGDCSRVAFTSTATNLALTRARRPYLKRLVTSAPPPGTKQIYVRILRGDPKDGTLIGQTFLASATNHRPGNGDSFDPSWSRPGKAFVFTSTATNLSGEDSAPNADVYLRETRRMFAKYEVTLCKTKRKPGRRVRICHHTVRGRQTLRLATRLVSQGADGDSSSATITDSGNLVAYESTATNLSPRDKDARSDIYRADLAHDPPAQELISTTKRAVANGNSYNPAITAAGVAVFFDSDASNLKVFPYFENDPNGLRDMMVGVPIYGSAGVDSLTWENRFADGPSQNPAPSARHNYVAFESSATDLDQTIRNPLREHAIFLRYDGPFSGDAVTER